VFTSVRVLIVLTSLLATACTDARSATEEPAPIVEAARVADVARDSLALPNAERSIKFAIIGDSGRGSLEQKAVAAQMAAYRQRFDYKFVLMAGDNIYEGPASPDDYRLKFEEPYKALLDAGVRFFAVLGNHDDPQQIHYKPFNMDGHRYYTFTPPVDLVTRLDTRVRFFALDSTNLDGTQMQWLEQALHESDAEWKIALLHYPLYSSGRYSLQARGTRFTLESTFVAGGVDVVFSGHEHIYERSNLQRGILHFITGGAGSLRAGDVKASPQIARGYDSDYHFMLAEVTDEGFFFQAINRQGETVDAGSLRRPRVTTAAPVTVDTPVRR
jgi:DNA repair exonuclease SbcCD nuclease subunit